MGELLAFLRQSAQGDLLPWAAQVEAGNRFGLSCRQVEEAALANGLLPLRYQRNRTTIAIDQQLLLFRSTVAVVGCGGLGGYIIEELARLGVGRIVAIDHDVFEEHNLNRQLFSSLDSLGRHKVEAAATRVGQINPVVVLVPVAESLSVENGERLLAGAQVAADALDSIPGRLALAAACRTSGIPLVHGSIAGWYGQIAVQFPGEEILHEIYARLPEAQGIETKLGNPACTPAVVGSLEAAEICKILTGQGAHFRGKYLAVDLLELEFETFEL